MAFLQIFSVPCLVPHIAVRRWFLIFLLLLLAPPHCVVSETTKDKKVVPPVAPVAPSKCVVSPVTRREVQIVFLKNWARRGIAADKLDSALVLAMHVDDRFDPQKHHTGPKYTSGLGAAYRDCPVYSQDSPICPPEWSLKEDKSWCEVEGKKLDAEIHLVENDKAADFDRGEREAIAIAMLESTGHAEPPEVGPIPVSEGGLDRLEKGDDWAKALELTTNVYADIHCHSSSSYIHLSLCFSRYQIMRLLRTPSEDASGAVPDTLTYSSMVYPITSNRYMEKLLTEGKNQNQRMKKIWLLGCKEATDPKFFLEADIMVQLNKSLAEQGEPIWRGSSCPGAYELLSHPEASNLGLQALVVSLGLFFMLACLWMQCRRASQKAEVDRMLVEAKKAGQSEIELRKSLAPRKIAASDGFVG